MGIKMEEKLKTQFGKKVQEYRNKASLTQEKLAERCGCGIPHISHIENGKVFPSIKILSSLAIHLGVDLKFLFDFSSKELESPAGDLVKLNRLLEVSEKKHTTLIYDVAVKVLGVIDS